MSHNATNWAIQQRGLKPINRIVLWHLADRHNKDLGYAFPSQARLADDCEISRATLNRSLVELEARKLIRREQRVDPVTKQQQPTRYFLAIDAGFNPQHVEPRVSDRDTALPVENPEIDGGEPVDNGESRVSETPVSVSQSSETQSSNRTISPLRPPEGEPHDTDALFRKMVEVWAEDKRGNLSKARRTFERLDSQVQKRAADLASATRIGIFMLKRPTPTLVQYLTSAAYDEFDDAPEIEGYRFLITPKRPEWSPWLGWVRKQHGQDGVESIVRTGLFRPQTRWPEGTASHG